MIAVLVRGPADGRAMEVVGARRLKIPVLPRLKEAMARYPWAPIGYKVAVYEIFIRCEKDLLYGFVGYE